TAGSRGVLRPRTRSRVLVRPVAPLPALLLTMSAVTLALPTSSIAHQTPEPSPARQVPPPAPGFGSVTGRVIDDTTQRPIVDVAVSISGTRQQVLTDDNGLFALQGIVPGEQRLELSHLGYGEHGRLVFVRANEALTLEARLSRATIELSPLVVEAVTELDRRRLTSGSAMKEVLRPEIDEAARTGRNLADALRQQLPGVSVRGGRMGGACLEYRGARSGSGPCRELTVFLDGVRIADPGLLYVTLSPSDVERMEILSPAEAGARYGSISGNGVLLIETRQGPRPASSDAEKEVFRTGFDWTGEDAPYRWRRVFASSFAANALSVGLSLALADQCLWRPEVGSLGLRTRCGGGATAGVAALSLALPTLTSSLAARWGGETSRSEGRITPTSLTTPLGLTSGYLLLIHGTGTSQAIGIGMLGVGAPVLTTLADRIFRSLH